MAIARSDMFGGTYDPRIQDFHWDREQEAFFLQMKKLASEKAYQDQLMIFQQNTYQPGLDNGSVGSIRTEPISESQVKAVLPVKSSLLLLCEDI